MTWRQSVTDFLGLKKNTLALLTMVVLVGLSEKMAERFLPLYLIAWGGGVFSIGLLSDMLGFGRNLLPWLRPVASPTTNLMAAFGFRLMGPLYFALFGKDLGST